MPAGRPTKYRPEMCDTVLEMFKDGCSKAEIGAALDICQDTFNRWEKENPEFSEAVKRGLWYSRAKWEQMGRENLKEREFNYTGWYMNMKNRFGYSDKTEGRMEVTGKDGGPIETKWTVEIVNLEGE